MAGGVLLTIALATVFWLFEVIRARIRKRPPPWKVPREREPATPLGRAFWGDGWQVPKLDPKQRRRMLWLGLLIYLGIAVVVASAALVTRAAGGSSGAAIAAGICSVVFCMILAIVIGAAVELRKRW